MKPLATSDNSFTPLIDFCCNKIRIEFTGSCLQQPKVSYTHRTILNIYIVYELGACNPHDDDPTLKNSLFGTVRLTKNADIDKYGYSVMELDLIKNQVFHFQVVSLVNM